MHAIANQSILASAVMSIPSLYFLVCWLVKDALMFFGYTTRTIFIAAWVFTFLAWILGVASIRLRLPNILGFSAYCHSAISSWGLINLFILLYIGRDYVTDRRLIPVITCLVFQPLIWHITSDVLCACKERILYEINRAPQYAPLNPANGMPKEEESV